MPNCIVASGFWGAYLYVNFICLNTTQRVCFWPVWNLFFSSGYLVYFHRNYRCTWCYSSYMLHMLCVWTVLCSLSLLVSLLNSWVLNCFHSCSSFLILQFYFPVVYLEITRYILDLLPFNTFTSAQIWLGKLKYLNSYYHRLSSIE